MILPPPPPSYDPRYERDRNRELDLGDALNIKSDRDGRINGVLTADLRDSGGQGANPLAFGAVGDGSADDRAALVAVDAEDAPTFLPAGKTFLVGSALTLSGKVISRGGRIKPASGVTVTISGPVECGAYQCFDTSAGGSIKFTGAAGVILPHWFGAVADGSTDDSGAIQAAIDAAPLSGVGQGYTVYLPRGDYRIASTIRVRRIITLSGKAARIRVDDGVTGIIVDRSNTSSDGGQGDHSVLEHFDIVAVGQTVTTAHGIRLYARATIRNVAVALFGGNGIHIEATSPAANANNWYLDRAKSEGNVGHGLYVQGPDANAGVAIASTFLNNTGWGVYDSSFLGNTYVGCHTHANTGGQYRSDNANARNVFLNCYSEPGYAASHVISPAIIIGGHHGSGFDSSTNAAWLETRSGIFTVQRPVQSRGGATPNQMEVSLNTDSANGEVLKWYHETYAPQNYRMKFQSEDLILNYQNQLANETFRITGPTTTYTLGTGVAQPHVFIPRKFAVGSRDDARLMGNATAAPVTGGPYAVGTIFWNRLPSVDANNMIVLGWICTVAGSPGTWQPMNVSTVSPAT